MDDFYSGATRVAERLLEGVASHLGLPRGLFAPSFDPHTSYLRLNYYPSCPEPCGMLSVNRHSDAGALTVLLQEHGTTALQVQSGSTASTALATYNSAVEHLTPFRVLCTGELRIELTVSSPKRARGRQYYRATPQKEVLLQC